MKTAGKTRYAGAVRALLDAGFKNVHTHGNNYSPNALFGPYRVPDALEATFVVREDAAQDPRV